MSVDPAAAAVPAHRGRPKKRLRSRWIQLQPAVTSTSEHTAAESASAVVAAPAPSYSALIRLTPSLLQALLAGHSANLQFDDKDRASFVIDNTSHTLRCSKEDPAQISVFEAIAYEHEDENEETLGSTAAPARLPLFAPFHAVARQLPVQVLHKFHAPRDIGLSDDAEPLPAASPKAKKQRKRKGAAEAEPATAAAEEPHDESAAPAKRPRAKKGGAASILAAAPSAKTAAEPLRARVIHLLAAQPRGLSLMDIAAALSVAPASLAPVLDAATRYTPPGVFTLLPALYAQLRVDTWPDYAPADRTRIVVCMRRLESEGVAAVTVSRELVERYRSAASSSTESAALAVIPLPEPHFPPPPVHSHLPDEIPASMIPASQLEFGSEIDGALAASSPPSVEPKLTPRVLSSYMEFLTLRTQFLQQRSVYQRIQNWIGQVESTLQQIRASATANPDAATLAVWQRQVGEWEQQQAQNLTTCRRKCAVLRLMLSHSLQSLTAYATQNGLTTTPLQIDHDN